MTSVRISDSAPVFMLYACQGAHRLFTGQSVCALQRSAPTPCTKTQHGLIKGSI